VLRISLSTKWVISVVRHLNCIWEELDSNFYFELPILKILSQEILNGDRKEGCSDTTVHV
jgi:hypothetical protein